MTAPRKRLVVVASMLALSALYALLVVLDPQTASAVSTGYVAIGLTGFFLVEHSCKHHPHKAKYPPDRRNDGGSDVEARVDRHIHRFETRMKRAFMKGFIAFVVLGLAISGALIAAGVGLKRQSKNTAEIQKQRYDVTYQNCLDQNLRHNRTLEKSKEKLPKDAQASIRLLVNELQPYVDNCREQAEARVKGSQ